MNESALRRFLPKVVVVRGGCWHWLGAVTGPGYGNFVIDGRRSSRKYTPAHRAAYEHFVGPIPQGLMLDHLCRNRRCANPAHLEAVTNAENIRRGARGRLVTHCAQGHEYTPENTRYKGNGTRRCHACNLAKSRARRERLYAQGLTCRGSARIVGVR